MVCAMDCCLFLLLHNRLHMLHAHWYPFILERPLVPLHLKDIATQIFYAKFFGHNFISAHQIPMDAQYERGENSLQSCQKKLYYQVLRFAYLKNSMLRCQAILNKQANLSLCYKRIALVQNDAVFQKIAYPI